MRDPSHEMHERAQRSLHPNQKQNENSKSHNAMFNEYYQRRLATGSGVEKELIRIRTQRSELRTGYQTFIQEALLKIYEIALLLNRNSEKWQAFCDHVDWGEFRQPPKKSNPETALKHALRFAVGFDKNATKFVSRYHRILQPFFVLRTPAATLAKKIARVGIARLDKDGDEPQNSKSTGASALGKHVVCTRGSHDQTASANALHALCNATEMASDLAHRGGLARQLRKSRVFRRGEVVRRKRALMTVQLMAIVHAFLLACWMLHDRDAWEDFCGLDIWIGRRRAPAFERPEEGLTFVLLATHGVDEVRTLYRVEPLFKPIIPLWRIVCDKNLDR